MVGGSLQVALKTKNQIKSLNKVVSRYICLQLPEATGHVRTIIPQHGSSADGRLFIGTSKGYVLDGSLQDKFKFLIQVCCINKGLFNLD
jgi:hypothetical protein